MIKNYNKRDTSREELNVSGQANLFYNNQSFSVPINIVNISYHGLEIVFSNNFFLIEFIKSQEFESSLFIVFNFEDVEYKLNMKINWINLKDIGEKDYYIISGLSFFNINEAKKILDFLITLQFKKVYF